jgi:adenine-specific DNA-methyltransferase
MDKIKNLGQVYTPENIVKLMFNLSEKKGDILEPSAGDGAFTKWIKENSERKITSIEVDPDNNQLDFIIMDFFDYDVSIKFPTIIGNPPYVSFKNISKETLNKIQSTTYISSYDNRTNLYIHFIRKCVEHLEDDGEMILITPREFIKATSSIKLNNFLYDSGTITDWYEYGDDVVFRGYSPTVVVWRFQKNDFSRKTKTNDGVKEFKINDGQISFTNTNDNFIKFSDLFFVKVGAVSGMDEIFTSENGNQMFVCSFTNKTGKLKKMFYNIKHPDLFKFKDKLINRKIKNFNEDNWWQWGRGLYESNSVRIYVNCKTRDNKPFFLNDNKYYDGSVLAIFPKVDVDMNKAVDFLNGVDWYELGFKVGGRLCFTQKSLENVYLPDYFKSLCP